MRAGLGQGGMGGDEQRDPELPRAQDSLKEGVSPFYFLRSLPAVNPVSSFPDPESQSHLLLVAFPSITVCPAILPSVL